jgi:DNA mismatch endonuclease (patch repair protein)
MSGIRGKNTRPEVVVRSLLHQSGFRFRLHGGRLPGRPDIVLNRYRSAIFVHGCFWHRHQGCKFAASPKTRGEFWQNKFDGNVRRDSENIAKLAQAGWRVLVVWECVVPRNVAQGDRLQKLMRDWLLFGRGSAEIGPDRALQNAPTG